MRAKTMHNIYIYIYIQEWPKKIAPLDKVP